MDLTFSEGPINTYSPHSDPMLACPSLGIQRIRYRWSHVCRRRKRPQSIGSLVSSKLIVIYFLTKSFALHLLPRLSALLACKSMPIVFMSLALAFLFPCIVFFVSPLRPSGLQLVMSLLLCHCNLFLSQVTCITSFAPPLGSPCLQNNTHCFYVIQTYVSAKSTALEACFIQNRTCPARNFHGWIWCLLYVTWYFLCIWTWRRDNNRWSQVSNSHN